MDPALPPYRADLSDKTVWCHYHDDRGRWCSSFVETHFVSLDLHRREALRRIVDVLGEGAPDV